MLKITHPTTLRPVVIARLLERHGSPLAPLAEEIYDLAIAYRIDAAFALAQCMVESQLGCLPLAQVNRNAALVRVALTRLAAPAARSTAPAGPLHAVGETQPILPPRYGDVYGSGYVTYPGWLAGLEEYFRLLRYVFVDAWHEEKVEQIAHAFLSTTPGRKPAPAARRGSSVPAPAQAPALRHQSLVSQQEISAYARRIARYRAAFQGQ
jgi:hypothetical protein